MLDLMGPFRVYFAPLGDIKNPYLKLLNPSRPEGQSVMRHLVEYVHGGPELEDEVLVLLDGANWRPHIVGACAVMAGVRGPRVVDRLWDRIDGASWVSPQLAVAAEAADPGYADEVHRRLEAVLAGCWLQRDGISPLDCPERPFGSAGIRAKALAALCALVDDELAADPAVVSFLARATDGGDRLARSWRAAVDEAGNP